MEGIINKFENSRVIWFMYIQLRIYRTESYENIGTGKLLEIITRHPETFIIRKMIKMIHSLEQNHRRIMIKGFELGNIIEHDLQDEMRLYEKAQQKARSIRFKIKRS